MDDPLTPETVRAFANRCFDRSEGYASHPRLWQQVGDLLAVLAEGMELERRQREDAVRDLVCGSG